MTSTPPWDGLLLSLQQNGDVEFATLAEALAHRSGLRGLSGTSGDIRVVIAGTQAGGAACQLTLEVFTHRIVREVGAMAAGTGGLDLLVFIGDIGEQLPEVRAAVSDQLGHLGIRLDRTANERAKADVDISTQDAASTVATAAGEERKITDGTRRGSSVKSLAGSERRPRGC